MKIAVTSQNFKTITNHAGKARRFIIYDVSSRNNIVETERLDLAPELAFHNFKGAKHPIDGVDVIISTSIGEGFARKMAMRNIKASIALSNDIAIAIGDYLVNGQRLPTPNPKHKDPNHVCICNCGNAA